MAARFVPIIIKVSGDREAELAVHEISNAFKNLNSTAETDTPRSMSAFSSAMRSAVIAGNFFSDMMRQGLSLLKSWLVDSTLFAARTHEMEIALHQMALANGISTDMIDHQEQSLIKLNITRQESAQILSQMIGANLDLSKATQLARVAQDTAVISGKNSSEAFADLTSAILLGNTEAFRAAGIYISVSAALEKGATALKVNQNALTEHQRTQILTNAVIDYGSRVTGTYEAAMGSASKQMRSMTRLLDDAKQAVGDLFQGAFVAAIKIGSDFLRQIKEEQGGLADLKTDIDSLSRALLDNQDTWKGWGGFVFEQIGNIVKGIEVLVHSIQGLKMLIDDIGNSPTINKLIAFYKATDPGGVTRIWDMIQADENKTATQSYTASTQRFPGFDPFGRSTVRLPGAGPRLEREQNIFTQIAPEINNLKVAVKENTEVQKTKTKKEPDALISSLVKANFGLAPVTPKDPKLAALIKGYAETFGIPLWIAYAQIFTESVRYSPAVISGKVVSPAGAIGLTQVLPGTAAQYGFSAASLKTPEGALTAWGTIMTDLFKRYGDWQLAILAYHQGPRTVDKLKTMLERRARGEITDVEAEKAYKSIIGPKGRAYLGTISAFETARNKEELPGLPGSTKLLLDQIRKGQVNTPLETSPQILTHLEQRLTLDEQYRAALVEQFDYKKQLEAVTLRLRNLDFEYLQDSQKMTIELANVDLDLAKIRRQNADDQFTEQRRLLLVRNEEKDLLIRVQNVQDEIANGPYNESLRIQLALLEDIANIRRRDEDAIKTQNRAEEELKDATLVHGEQVRAAVLEHLASQRTMTEAWSDGIISAYDKVLGFIDRGIEKITHGIPIITQLVSSLVHQLANRVFQRFLDALFPPSGGGGGAPVLAGYPGGTPPFAGNLFGGGGNQSISQRLLSFLPGGGAGSTRYAAGLPFLGNLSALTSEGITAPTSTLGGNVGLPIRPTPWGDILSAGGVNVGSSAGKFSLSGFGASIAPLLGLSLGALAGGQSRFGQGLGAAGGALGGLAIASLLGSGSATSALGSIATLGGVLPFALPILPIAGALIVGAILLARNAARRKNETDRAALNNDTYSQIIQVLNDARSGRYDSPGAAIAAFDQIKSQYFQRISGYDSKTKRIATDVWNDTKNGFEYYRPLIKQAAETAAVAKSRAGKLSPEFADGGAVFSQIQGMRHLRFADGGFSGLMPGAYDRRDSHLIAVSGNEVVLTPRQWQPITGYLKAVKVPGFADGGPTGTQPSRLLQGDGDIIIEELTLNMEMGTEFASKVFQAGGKTPDGKKVIIKTVKAEQRRGGI